MDISLDGGAGGDGQIDLTENEVVEAENLFETEGVEAETPFGQTDQDHAAVESVLEDELFADVPLATNSVGYSPSITTDFSEPFDVVYCDAKTPISANYDPGRLVDSAWQSLEPHGHKQVWETGFWNEFFNPNHDQFDFAQSSKRPFPVDFPAVEAASRDAVGDRAVSKPRFECSGFLQHIKDVPELTWREQREAQWETAIRRWISLIDSWNTDSCELVRIIHEGASFSAKAQILVDVFFNKAPQTLLKRVNSLSRLTNALIATGLTFPCNEDQFYTFLKRESQSGAPSSRLKAIFEALVFARHVLGVASLEDVIASRRCLGAASTSIFSSPRQATPFKVKQLLKFHEILAHHSDPWNRAMAGMILFCTYGRSRWSDAQHAEDLMWDLDDDGKVWALEIKTSVHKTARALHLRHMFLPIVAPAYGVSEFNWASRWLEVRQLLGIHDLSVYPLMPAPGVDLTPTKRALSTEEAKKWMQYLLGQELIATTDKLSSHSCKSTCLSFLAKRGVNLEDRLLLGYHTNKLRMGLVYSRDGAARPLAVLSHVLSEIRAGTFEPDNTRSGRLKENSISLNDLHNLVYPPASFEPPAEPHSDFNAEQQKDADADPDPGHVTTDTDETEDERNFVSPVVGHLTFQIPKDKSAWLNRSTKMIHLSEHNHKRVLLCGRAVTLNVTPLETAIRFDSAKCKQCFRQLHGESKESR